MIPAAPVLRTSNQIGITHRVIGGATHQPTPSLERNPHHRIGLFGRLSKDLEQLIMSFLAARDNVHLISTCHGLQNAGTHIWMVLFEREMPGAYARLKHRIQKLEPIMQHGMWRRFHTLQRTYNEVSHLKIVNTIPDVDTLDGGFTLAISLPNGNFATNYKTIHGSIWKESGEQVRTFEGHTNTIMDMCVLPNGCIVTASLDRTARLWSIDGVAILTLLHDEAVNKVVSLSDGHFVTAGPNRARIWSNRGEAVVSIPCIFGMFTHLVALKNDRFATASTRMIVEFRSVKTGMFHRFKVRNTIIDMAFTGKCLAMACERGTVSVWSFHEQAMTTFSMKGDLIGIFSLPGSRLAVSSLSATYLVDEKGKPLTLLQKKCTYCVRALPGHRIVTGQFKSLHIWHYDYDIEAEIEKELSMAPMGASASVFQTIQSVLRIHHRRCSSKIIAAIAMIVMSLAIRFLIPDRSP